VHLEHVQREADALPELPEVETIRRQLEPLVVGRKLVEAWAFPHPKFEPGLEAAGAVVEVVASGVPVFVVTNSLRLRRFHSAREGLTS